MSTLWLPKEGAWLASDLCYSGCHCWVCPDIQGFGRVNSWIQVLRERLEVLTATGTTVTVYPGHGACGGLDVIDSTIKYLQDFLFVVKSATSPKRAIQEMVSRYPTYKGGDLMLRMSVSSFVPVPR